MYFEKAFLIKKITAWCKETGRELTYREKDLISSKVSTMLDKHRVMSFEEFNELLNHNETLAVCAEIDFNDEIVSIEEVGIIDMIDFDISGNRLFFADNILTHNSAVGDTNADNSSVSDSLGTIMTADLVLFLLQNDDMKLNNEIVCKATKNRFTGRTDTWMMNVDYEHMRFNDAVVQHSTTIGEVSDDKVKLGDINDDFTLGTTPERLKEVTEFADKEIKDILVEDMEKVIEHDKNLDEKDPFQGDSIADIFADLGI